jgi:PQQ-dependent catabolism-associated CXXCW motif protein
MSGIAAFSGNTALRVLAGLLLVAAAAVAPAGESFGEEDRSWSVAPPADYRARDYHAPTPDGVPGARVVTTAELKEMLAREQRPLLVDVLSGPAHRTLPGSLWLHNGGLGDFNAEEEKRFLDALARIAGHDKAREIVFFCSGARCWLSYNAALRAARAGYGNVYWYRGGIEAWRAAGFPTHTSTNFQW